jgi:hypothetical protein
MFYEFANIGKLSTDCFIVVDLSKIFLAFERILYAQTVQMNYLISARKLKGTGFGA